MSPNLNVEFCSMKQHMGRGGSSIQGSTNNQPPTNSCCFFQDTDEWTTLTSKGGIDLLNAVGFG